MTDPSIANRQSQTTNPPVPIGIAVVEHGGRYLVGTRGPHVPLAGYAEFPGGKCLPGESPADAAVRECDEETGLRIVAEECLLRLEFTYPHATVDLHFWRCRPADPDDISDSHRGYRWLTRKELADQRFPEANAQVLALLGVPSESAERPAERGSSRQGTDSRG